MLLLAKIICRRCQRNYYKSLAEWHWREENLSTRIKPRPIAFCPPQIPHRLAWNQTRASRWDLRLTAPWPGTAYLCREVGKKQLQKFQERLWKYKNLKWHETTKATWGNTPGLPVGVRCEIPGLSYSSTNDRLVLPTSPVYLSPSCTPPL